VLLLREMIEQDGTEEGAGVCDETTGFRACGGSEGE
jgi:hypothetical protein